MLEPCQRCSIGPEISVASCAFALVLFFAHSASAAAVFEAWGFAGIVVPDLPQGVEIQISNAATSAGGEILPGVEPGSSVTHTATLGTAAIGDPGLVNFGFDDLLNDAGVNPTDFSATASAFVAGAAFPPDTALANATASMDISIFNNTDAEFSATLIFVSIVAAFTDIDRFPLESVAASARGWTGRTFASARSQSRDTDPNSNSGFASGEVALALGATEFRRFSIEANAEAGPVSNIPEPTTALLVGLGLVGLCARGRTDAATRGRWQRE